MAGLTCRGLGFGFALTLLCWSATAQTSTFPVYEPTLPVVSINRENLFQRSDLGMQLSDVLSKRQAALVAENDRLAATLEQEELELTELRKTLSAAKFEPMAEAFDVKVKNVRRVQDQKSVDLAKALESMRFRFFRQAESVIAKMMQESGILFVLDEKAIWMSQGGDVTNTVIERMNSAYAAGEISIE